MKTFRGLGLLLFFGTQSAVFGETIVNAWTNATSSYWEFQTNWSLGIRPDQSQSVYITNAGWKAVAIGANTAQNFPTSMQIQDLQIASPPDSFNELLMNFSGFQAPLTTTSLTVGSNSSVVVQSSSLEAGNVTLYGTFSQSDFSQVKVDGLMQMGPFGGGGAYYLTNGTLSVNAGELIGGFDGPGQFVQYGGDNKVGGTLYADSNNNKFGSIFVNLQGEFDIYDGQLTATNGILLGSGDYADLASFHQYGGTVNADSVINGNYVLNGGTITGGMSVVARNSYQRANASVLQSGGTNHAISLDLGYPNIFGGVAFYTLSNGVVRVDSSVGFYGGQFWQYNGLHTIASDLVMQGTSLGGFGSVNADYFLKGGTLAAGGLTAQRAIFQQDGGTNFIAGDLVLIAAPPPQNGRGPETDQYTLGGGFLSARNLIVNAAYYGGFRQTGGSNQITEKLTVQGVSPGAFYYTLAGGTLTVKDIYVADGAFFQHTNGAIVHSGLLTLSQGEWRAAAAAQSLGPLQLTIGTSNNNSAITFPSSSSTLRFANSSAQPWDSSAVLYITNWSGSASGGGATQLYFGSNSGGLTPQQLSQIRFNISGGLYPAAILATGEVVPVAPPILSYTRNGGTLTLTWPSGWFLQSSTNLAGPYQDVNGATSPWPLSMSKPQELFRLRQ